MPRISRADVSGWSCAERKNGDCVNPFGCHCREITSLMERVEQLEGKRPALVIDNEPLVTKHRPDPELDHTLSVVSDALNATGV